ncbi:MAG: hypothetical protein JST54_04620 [Deltaproteobacteria bacterium]|nr:hypothetical protein [Deltaproteobacteria bacterium]
MQPTRRQWVVWGVSGLVGVLLLGALTVTAVYLSTSFVIGYAQIPPPTVEATKPDPTQAVGR